MTGHAVVDIIDSGRRCFFLYALLVMDESSTVVLLIDEELSDRRIVVAGNKWGGGSTEPVRRCKAVLLDRDGVLSQWAEGDDARDVTALEERLATTNVDTISTSPLSVDRNDSSSWVAAMFRPAKDLICRIRRCKNKGYQAEPWFTGYAYLSWICYSPTFRHG